jgi:hypothetical protein
MRVTFVLLTVDLSGGARVAASSVDHLARRRDEVPVVSLPTAKLPLPQQARVALAASRWPHEKSVGSHLDSIDVSHRLLERRQPVSGYDVPDVWDSR